MNNQRLILANEARTHTLTYFPPEDVSVIDILVLVELTGKKEGEEFERLGIYIAKDIIPSAN
jgi:hypothetical protein